MKDQEFKPGDKFYVVDRFLTGEPYVDEMIVKSVGKCVYITVNRRRIDKSKALTLDQAKVKWEELRQKSIENAEKLITKLKERQFRVSPAYDPAAFPDTKIKV